MTEEKITSEAVPEPQTTIEPASASETAPQTPKTILKILLFSVLGLVLVAGLVFGGYKLGQKQLVSEPKPTPTPSLVATPTPLSSEAPAKEEDPTANWKTYRNEKYEISFKYPTEWVKEGSPFENYNNPNRATGFKDECLTNYSEGWIIKDNLKTKWGALRADFDVDISVTNPEKWTLEQWIENCRKRTGEERKTFVINNRNIILYSWAGEPGNGGIANSQIYFIENNQKFYVLSFLNHSFIEDFEKTEGLLLRTLVFF